MARGFRQGIFTPRCPEKYRGDVLNIIFRSSWELSFCQFLDNNPNILEWASEEIAIPYVKPTDGRIHRYYIDFWLKYKDKHGDIKQSLIEIKPEKQTKPPSVRGKSKKTQLHEAITYAVNIAKWQSATSFAKSHGMEFKIVNETQLFK